MAQSVRITRLSKQGEGIGEWGERAIFIEGALPGETVLVEAQAAGKVLRGTLLEVLEKSPARREPFCPLSTECGGCPWMHLREEEQRSAKLEIVLSALEHLGGFRREDVPVLPAVAAGPSIGYRRRAVFEVSSGKLAYHGRRSQKTVPVEECPALVPSLSSLPGRLTVVLQPWMKDIERIHLLAEGERTAAALILRGAIRPRHRDAAAAAMADAGLSGIWLAPKEGKGEALGEPILKEAAFSLEGQPLFLRPDVFCQANGAVNRELLKAALALLQLRGDEDVLELYSGNGNFTFEIAATAKRVVAIESSGSAVGLAQRSARASPRGNIRFVEGEVQKVVRGLCQEGARFDALLLDPPRAGAKGIGEWARALRARRVVYVSCDPASLARDAKALSARGFAPCALQLVDLFPQTRHVESVMAFSSEA
jgi:23S rRNA (uracil1939-C5)-methyltransferase